MKVLGLTGGIGSGKSLAAQLFAEHGIPTYDADQAAREARDPTSPVAPEILRVFGTLDPREIARKSFEGPEAQRFRETLEAIVIPYIQQQYLAWAARRPAKVGLYEASLLIERDRYREFEGLIVVLSPLEQRRERLIQRGFSPAQIEGRIAAQVGDEERQRVADHILHNTGSLEDLRAQVADLAKVLLAA